MGFIVRPGFQDFSSTSETYYLRINKSLKFYEPQTLSFGKMWIIITVTEYISRLKFRSLNTADNALHSLNTLIFVT